MKWISSILDGLDIKISIKNMEKGIVYLFLGAVIYFVLPNNILNNIYQKLTNNKTINMIVIILFFFHWNLLHKKNSRNSYQNT